MAVLRPMLLVLAAAIGAATPAYGAWAQVRDLVYRAEKLDRGPEKERTLRTAYKLAKESVRQRPNESNEHLWLANAAGRLAQISGSKEKIQLAGVVKLSAERAVQLDQSNAAAYMTLGAWHYYVAAVSWIEREVARAIFGDLPEATYEKAVEYLTLALRSRVENPVEVHFLRGAAYEELDQEERARADFRACVAGTARTHHEKKLQARAKRRLD